MRAEERRGAPSPAPARRNGTARPPAPRSTAARRAPPSNRSSASGGAANGSAARRDDARRRGGDGGRAGVGPARPLCRGRTRSERRSRAWPSRCGAGRAARRWPTRRRARGTRSVTTGACSLPWRGSPGRAGRAGKEELSETSRMKGSELREKRRAFTGCWIRSYRAALLSRALAAESRCFCADLDARCRPRLSRFSDSAVRCAALRSRRHARPRYFPRHQQRRARRPCTCSVFLWWWS